MTWIKVSAAAKLGDTSPDMVRQLIREKRINFRRLRYEYEVDQASFEAYLERRTEIREAIQPVRRRKQVSEGVGEE